MNSINKVYYKVLDKDMKSPYKGFQYEMNKTYSTDKELELCTNGFHACKNMYELLLWTDVDNNLKDYRFFECILGDKVIEYNNNHKVVSNSITLIKEISFEEVDKNIKENIEVLVHDKNWPVRKAVARQGYGLDILIHDEDWRVRVAVAWQGYGLDILINDKHSHIRRAVAQQGYRLDILINDKHSYVRAAVVGQGYGLDILIHDEDWCIRNIAKHMLGKEDWKMSNNNKVYYKVLDNDMCSPYQLFQYEMNKTYSTDEELELCDNGFHACKEMYDMIRWTDVNNLKDCRFFECTLGNKIIEGNHKVVSNSITLTKEISFEEVDKSIKENLNILVHDKDDYVRRSVAELGYCLDILVHDKDWFVRYTVAKQGYGLDILINDTDEDVREAVARQRYGLDIPNKR